LKPCSERRWQRPKFDNRSAASVTEARLLNISELPVLPWKSGPGPREPLEINLGFIVC
jgi:hypothetical protein